MPAKPQFKLRSETNFAKLQKPQNQNISSSAAEVPSSCLRRIRMRGNGKGPRRNAERILEPCSSTHTRTHTFEKSWQNFLINFNDCGCPGICRLVFVTLAQGARCNFDGLGLPCVVWSGLVWSFFPSSMATCSLLPTCVVFCCNFWLYPKVETTNGLP